MSAARRHTRRGAAALVASALMAGALVVAGCGGGGESADEAGMFDIYLTDAERFHEQSSYWPKYLFYGGEYAQDIGEVDEGDDQEFDFSWIDYSYDNPDTLEDESELDVVTYFVEYDSFIQYSDEAENCPPESWDFDAACFSLPAGVYIFNVLGSVPAQPFDTVRLRADDFAQLVLVEPGWRRPPVAGAAVRAAFPTPPGTPPASEVTRMLAARELDWLPSAVTSRSVCFERGETGARESACLSAPLMTLDVSWPVMIVVTEQGEFEHLALIDPDLITPLMEAMGAAYRAQPYDAGDQ